MLVDQPEIQPRFYVRLILAVNALLMVIQLTQIQREWITTPSHVRGEVAVWSLAIITVLVWLFSLIGFRTIKAVFRPVMRWLFADRLRTWMAAFGVFEFWVLFGQAVDHHTLFSHGAEMFGVAAFVNAVGLLLARHVYGPDTPRDAFASSAPSYRPNGSKPFALGASGGRIKADLTPWLLSVIIALAAFAVSVWMWLYAPPLGYGHSDSYRYFYGSEGFLGRVPFDFDWYTYPYPFTIALTRLLADTMVSITLLQHVLRLGVAVGAFWCLRRANQWLAFAAGVLIALSPITAFQAQALLSESIYGGLVAVIVLLAFVSSQRDERLYLAALIGIGVLLGWVSLFRPAGRLLIVPVVIVVAVAGRSWKRPLVIAGSFAVMVVVLAFGQLSIDGNFRFGTDDESYYAFPLVYLGLFDVDNGPVAESYQKMIIEWEGCDYTFPPDRGYLPEHWPHILHNCSVAYNAATGAELSTKDLYFEAIRAQPRKFIGGMWREMRLYLTHSDTDAVALNRMERQRYIVRSFANVDACEGERPEIFDQSTVDSWADYSCTYQVNEKLVSDKSMQGAYRLSLNLMQPYRLQGESVWARFWAMLALGAFLLLESSARSRAVLVLCLLFIGYHAVVTVFGLFPRPRYVFVMAPAFVITAALLYFTLVDEIVRSRSRVVRIMAVAGLVLIPLLPGLAKHLWVDQVWKGEYYQNIALAGKPTVVRDDPVVTFDWGENPPFKGWEADSFSIRWERSELFDEGVYTFAVKSDDGVRVYVDGELIINNWYVGGHDWISVERRMTAGRHRLTVEYFEDQGAASIQMGYFPSEGE